MFPFFKEVHLISRAAITASLCCLFLLEPGYSQDSHAKAKARYEKALLRGRELVKDCREISTRFFDGSLEDSYRWKEKWDVAAKNLADHRTELEESAIDWFLKCESPDQELLHTLGVVSLETYAAGDYEMTYTILEKIEKFLPKEDIKLKRRLALTGIKCNKFDRGLAFAKSPNGAESIGELESQLDKNMFMLTPLLVRNWKQEAKIRAKEAEADDLPRVKLQIGSGEVVVELFENEAPETVANFISLVESGYYDDSFLAPTIKGIAAQTGLLNRSKGVAPVGYVIKNESRLPNCRKHFVGSLSMVSDGIKDSAATMFAITLVPNPDLDWDGSKEDEKCQTVFGRVVSGMDVVQALPATEEIDKETKKPKAIKDVTPLTIDKAMVIRKRDHEYKFEKIIKDANKQSAQPEGSQTSQ